jgi:DNA primase
MASPGDFAYTVKQQADIVRVIGDYVKLKKAGAQNYSGLCPFHNEKTASFSVHATRQFYHCFGCGASGDVFSFVQKIENVTFPEAVRAIAQKLGIALPKVSYSSPAEAKEARRRTALLEIHERASAFFQEYLRRPEGAHAREYLKGRGLNEKTIARFRIGYAPDSGFILRDRLLGEFDEEVLRESGLFSWKQEDSRQSSSVSRKEEGAQPASRGAQESNPANDQQHPGFLETAAAENVAADLRRRNPEPGVLAMYSKFRNRVMFPIASEQGRIIAFTGRTLSTDEKAGPKYLNSPETPIYSKSRVLFNLDQAKEAIRKFDYAILVEGQMDCISVFAAKFENVIASSGTAFTEPQARLLSRLTKNVVVNFDPDTAGAKATERTLGLLVQEEFQIKVLTLEPGFDPDLFMRRRGREAYEDALRHSQRYFDYLIERARSQFPVRTADGKVKAVNFLLPHVQRVPNRIARDELANEIAQKLAIDSAVLRQELKHAVAKRSTAQVKSPMQGQVTKAERILVRALASATEMQAAEEHMSARDGAEEEFDPARQAQFALMNERLHEGLATESLVAVLLSAGPDMVDVMQLPLQESDRQMLAAILMEEDAELTPEILESAVHALREQRWLRRQRELTSSIREAERKQDVAALARLTQEKLKLDRVLAGGPPSV